MKLSELPNLEAKPVLIRGVALYVRPLSALQNIALLRQWPESPPPRIGADEQARALETEYRRERQIRQASLLVAEAGIVAGLQGSDGGRWGPEWNHSKLRAWIEEIAAEITEDEILAILRSANSGRESITTAAPEPPEVAP